MSSTFPPSPSDNVSINIYSAVIILYFLITIAIQIMLLLRSFIFPLINMDNDLAPNQPLLSLMLQKLPGWVIYLIQSSTILKKKKTTFKHHQIGFCKIAVSQFFFNNKMHYFEDLRCVCTVQPPCKNTTAYSNLSLAWLFLTFIKRLYSVRTKLKD